VVGFGARAIDPGDEPKYLNSPETPLYHKGNHLYGLHLAAASIRERDQALLMEGYMDVISAHAHGFPQAVGVLGTALTPSQARAILRHTPSKRVVLSFDADKAGQQAAERGLTTLRDVTAGLGMEVRVLAVPEGKDPDAYLRKEGSEAFERLLAEAPDLIQFQLSRALASSDTASPEGRMRAVAACVPILRQIENHVSQDYYVTWLSQLLGLREESIRLEIKRGMRHNGSPSRGPQLTVKKLSAREAEQILLYLMVEHPVVKDTVRDKLAGIGFEPVHQEIRERIEWLTSANPRFSWAELLDQFAGQEVQKTVSAVMFAEYDKWGSEPDRLAEDCIDTLLYSYWEHEVARLKQQLKDEGASMGREAHEAAIKRLEDLVNYLVQLKHKRHNLNTSSKASTGDN
jgi:DNA primase